MGKVLATYTHIRGCGAQEFLDEGMFHIALRMSPRGKTKTWVSVINKYSPEALFGDRGAEMEEEVYPLMTDPRRTGVKVNTGMEVGVQPSQQEHNLAMSVGSLF